MAVGIPVTADALNYKAAQAVLALREAFSQVETVSKWLANANVSPDPLMADFGYTEDEAYVLRVFFQTMDTCRIDNAATFDIGRKITGLD